MPAQRDLLTQLTRDEPLALVGRFELPVRDRCVREQLIEAIAQASSVALSEVLLRYPGSARKEAGSVRLSA